MLLGPPRIGVQLMCWNGKFRVLSTGINEWKREQHFYSAFLYVHLERTTCMYSLENKILR